MNTVSQIEPVSAKIVLNIFRGTPSKGQLMKLCEQKVIFPYREATGTGSNRLFNFYNLMEIGIWRQLYFLGISSTRIATILANLRKDEEDKPKLITHDFFLCSTGLRGTTDLHVPEPSLNEWMIQAVISLPELIQSLQQGKLCEDPPGMGAYPKPGNMVLVDLKAIRSALLNYFEASVSL